MQVLRSETKHVVLLDAKFCKVEPHAKKSVLPAEKLNASPACFTGRAAHLQPAPPLLSVAPRAAGLCCQRSHTNSAPPPLPARRELRRSPAFASAPTKPDSRPSRLCKDLQRQPWKSPKPFVLQNELKVFQVAVRVKNKQQGTKPGLVAWEERSPEGPRAPTAVPLGDAPHLPWAKHPTLQKANAARAGVSLH